MGVRSAAAIRRAGGMAASRVSPEANVGWRDGRVKSLTPASSFGEPAITAWMTRYEHIRSEAGSSTFAEWRWDRWRRRVCVTSWGYERGVTSTHCDLDWLPRRGASVPRRDSTMARDTTRR